MGKTKKIKQDELSKEDRRNPYVFKTVFEREQFFKDKIKLLKLAGKEYYADYTNGIMTSPLKVDSLMRLLMKEEINKSQYSLGSHYYFCSNLFAKMKSSSMEVIDCSGGNAEKFFALRADAGRFIEEADNLCSPLEKRMLQGVCGRNESIRNVCGGTHGRAYSRGMMALVSALRKMEDYFGSHYISY